MILMKANEKTIIKASKIIAKGGLVVYPTDTVYGLGCDPFNDNSVKRIIDVKKRKQNPLPILGISKEEIQRIAYFDEMSAQLASRFWPGPLTLILNKKKKLPDSVTNNLPTIGVRVPNCDVARRLIELSGGLLIGTSANFSGQKSCISAQDVLLQIGEKVDLILDGGITRLGKESTVVKIVGGQIRIFRRGAFSENQLINGLS